MAVAQYHLGFGLWAVGICGHQLVLGVTAMPLNIHIKGTAVKPLQLTLSQSAMWIHMMDDGSSVPQMINEEHHVDEDSNQRDPKWATHDWGEINVVLESGRLPKPEKESEKEHDQEESESEEVDEFPSPSPSEHQDGVRAGQEFVSNPNPELAGQDRDSGIAAAVAGGGNSGNGIRGDGDAADTSKQSRKRIGDQNAFSEKRVR